jgi:hypothetical protein
VISAALVSVFIAVLGCGLIWAHTQPEEES